MAVELDADAVVRALVREGSGERGLAIAPRNGADAGGLARGGRTPVRADGQRRAKLRAVLESEADLRANALKLRQPAGTSGSECRAAPPRP